MNIQKQIESANSWLQENRQNYSHITLERVQRRLDSTSNLLSIEADSKTVKGSEQGYLTGILYFAPHKICGINLCPMAKTCIKDCLFNSGRGKFSNVTEARIIKTLAYFLDPVKFKHNLIKSIEKLERKAKKQGKIPVVRLNGTSDMLIERSFKDIMAKFSHIQFYDYTKIAVRFKKELPSNYDLTFSYDGTNWNDCKQVLDNGGRVAVVFKNGLPNYFDGYSVKNGDETDLRFLDSSGIIGLNAKGTAKKDNSDDLFIIDSSTDEKCTILDPKFYQDMVS